MQVKPRFDNYKILEQNPIFKDDTGAELCLTHFSAKISGDESIIVDSNYTFWTVVSKSSYTWNNKAVSYSDILNKGFFLSLQKAGYKWN